MPASIETVMKKLYGSLQAIQFHEGVKSQEGKRIEEAFTLLSASEGTIESKTQKRRECYRELLKILHKVAGRQAVVLCAVTFGQSAVANMRESLKIGLVAALKAEREELSCAILEKLGEEYAAKGEPIAVVAILDLDVVTVSLPHSAQQSAFDQQLQWTESVSRLLSCVRIRAETSYPRPRTGSKRNMPLGSRPATATCSTHWRCLRINNTGCSGHQDVGSGSRHRVLDQYVYRQLIARYHDPDI